MGDKLKIAFAILALAILAWIIFHPTRWEGFFYPDKSDLSIYESSGQLKSLDECRLWAQAKARSGSWPNADYECGKNCKHDFQNDISICDETVR